HTCCRTSAGSDQNRLRVARPRAHGHTIISSATAFTNLVLRPRLSTCHLPAAFCAAATGLGAGLHLGVVPHLLAAFGALFTHLGADGAGTRMQVCSEQHEIGARPVDFGAGEQQLDVLGLRVLAALLQAVCNCA